MAEDSKQVAPVYVGWQTFKNALDQLSQGLPHFIDKKVFEGQSWGVQAQLMSAMKFLGLIDDGGVPTPALVALAVPDEEERKRQLEKIIRERYADLFALDLSKVTPTQLSQQMYTSYGATGDTREKAMRFFLGMLGYLEIPVSRFVKVPKAGGGGSNGGASRKRRARKAKPAVEVASTPPPPPVVQTAGTSKSITLKRGETLTLSVTADFFAMDPGDLDFVFGLHREMLKYEQGILSGQSQTDTGGEE